MDKTAIYQYSWEYAMQNGEQDAHRQSRMANEACAKAVCQAIDNAHRDEYSYDIKAAVKSVAGQFGFERMNFLLAGCIQHSFGDGRYSQVNRDWASRFQIPDDRHGGFHIPAHPAVLDGFVSEARLSHVNALAEDIGKYEDKRHISEKNRLTHYDAGLGVYAVKASYPRLLERHHEIMERNKTRRASAMERLAAAKRDVKPPAPKGAGKKKDLEME